MTPPLQLCFYADDFTGATDALECLATAGLATMLFIDPPSVEQLAAYPHLQAIGVAGSTRSMETVALGRELRDALPRLRALGPRHVHYKVCSTFDSSPEIGSIGRAIDVGFDVFDPPFVPLVVGAPGLGRYCVFGNLFACMGIGSTGEIYRLDRHPAASCHPVTPADESDLRWYLSRQTERQVRLFDVLMHELSAEIAMSTLERLWLDQPVILFDALYPEHLRRIGALIDAHADEQPLYSVGSSGVETALADHWRESGQLKQAADWPSLDEMEAALVLSGSCSPVTEGQIAWALAHGFAEVALNTLDLVGGNVSGAEICSQAAVAAIAALARGQSVIVHTGRGPDDARVAATRQRVAGDVGSQAATTETVKRLSSALGEIGRQCLESVNLRRLCIAGGDTSSHVARSLQIEALEMVAPLSPGAPLCRAKAIGPADGVEINFKGGQVGSEDYFETVRRGRLSR